MQPIVLLTGTGLIAARLAEKLADKAYVVRFLSRRRGVNCFLWNVGEGYVDAGAFDGVSHIVHLSGENIAGKPWTDKQKKKIISSRIDSARLILDTLKKRKVQIKSFVSASAVGYYGAQTTDAIYCETDKQGDDFVGAVCEQWEAAADGFAESNTAHRVVKVRMGMVLSRRGGALPKISTPIRYHFAPTFGGGRQYVPWIHIDDLCGIIEYAIENKHMTGVFNAVAPMQITSKAFTKAIAQSMNKPVFVLGIPRIAIKLLFGEMSMLLLEGSRVSSEKIKEYGFVFRHPFITQALANL